MPTLDEIHEKFMHLSRRLDERSRRVWAATEANVLGYGGVTLVSKATGISRISAESGCPQRYGTEYVRNGICNQLLFVAPYEGWRRVDVSERKTRKDWAEQANKLVDEDFPNADKINRVMDNLNTHSPASLYKAFEPAEAKRIWDRLEIHYTPKHGSWLNMSEIELSVLNHHGLSERVPDVERMRSEISAWQNKRNEQRCTIKWSFTVEKARKKMGKTYPHLDY